VPRKIPSASRRSPRGRPTVRVAASQTSNTSTIVTPPIARLPNSMNA
jgi:hypothetical protein